MKYREFGLVILLLLVAVPRSGASVSCNSTDECQTISTKSECRNGTCSNPFDQGCFYVLMPGWEEKRVCNSDDTWHDRGECDLPQFAMYFDYVDVNPEIRPLTLNWASTIYEAWILQIVLSELLEVPTTVETGSPNSTLSFYNLSTFYSFDNHSLVETWGRPMEAASSDYREALNRAHLLGADCRQADNKNTDDYEACGHYIPEVWTESPCLTNMVEEGVLQHPEAMGILGYESWFVTKFTAEQDPTLTSFLGLQGEINRRKLAETFLRPTTWKDYCDIVSQNNCETDDGVARRAPLNKIEEERMFVEGLYTGHFRKTEKNDCDANPSNCTGHIADYPCEWRSYVLQQTYHLNISLESDGKEVNGGYTHSQLTEMWLAANRTKSNLMMMWWVPNANYQAFLGTDAEFQKVTLPTPTQACMEARQVNGGDVCSTGVGDPEGACDYMPRSVQKYISRDLYEVINNPWISEAVRSPGYEVLRRFSISAIQMSEIFSYSEIYDSPQEALCQWVVNNTDYIYSLIPETYPRVIQRSNPFPPLFYVAIILASISLLEVISTGVVLFLQRKRRIIQHAQIEFMWIILSGYFLVSIGAILEALPPSDASCVLIAWFSFLGNTLSIVPLLVKIAAINSLMNAARRMQRRVMSRKRLFGIVFLIISIVVVYLIVWTSIDPRRKIPGYVLTDTKTESGETVVLVSFFCSSQSLAWRTTAVGWNLLLLIASTVLAFQSRKVREEFNESFPLALLIYTNLLFLVFQLLIAVLSVLATNLQIAGTALTYSGSIIASLNEIFNVNIYFTPKFATKENTPAGVNQSFISGTNLSSGAVRPSVVGVPARVVKANVHDIKSRLRDVKSNAASGVPVPEEEWECIHRLLDKMSNETGESRSRRSSDGTRKRDSNLNSVPEEDESGPVEANGEKEPNGKM